MSSPGERLRSLRESYRVTQQGLADVLGWTRGQVNRAEGNRRPVTARQTERAAAGLGWTYEQVRAFLQGDLPLPAAVSISRRAFDKLRDVERVRQERKDRLTRAIEKAGDQTDVSDAITPVAYELFERIGWDLPDDRMISHIIRLHEEIDRYIQAHERGSVRAPVRTKLPQP